MTGYRFLECDASLPIGTFKETECVSLIIMTGKNAVATIYNAGHQFTRGIWVDNTLLLDDFLSFRCELIPYDVECFFHWADFIGLNRCSCITFYAACAVAGCYIAAEVLAENVEADEGALDFEHVVCGIVCCVVCCMD